MKIASWAALLSVLVANASAQNGLVARYLLNNNANDSVGSNHGTVVNAVPAQDRNGQINSAYRFNGTSSRIEFGTPPPLTQANNWAITGWVKPAGGGAGGLAVYVGSDNGVSSDGFGFGVGSDLSLQGFVPAAGGFFAAGISLPNTNTWYHVIMLRTNGSISFYVNGQKTPGTSAVAVSAPSDMTFGSQNGLRYFTGTLDDIRVYNRALTTNEVAAVYAGNEGPCYPHAARATAVVLSGFVVAATITDGGCGYTNAPTVTITGGGGSGATATATVSNGIVTAVTMTSAGCCYTNEPLFIFTSPPFPTSVSIKLSKVAITQHVMVGRTYVLEGTSDLVNWIAVGSPYTAQTEDVVAEVDVDLGYRYFRSREVIGDP